MVPIRGQTVLVRNNSGGDFFFDDGKELDEVCYIMQRAAGKDSSLTKHHGKSRLNLIGGGTLLGGCTQLGNWDSQVDPNLANRIMKRAIDLCPALTDGKGIEHLSIINHGVGLRPFRLGGPRLETEKIDGVRVVHHYGHAGYGYQTSYGSSREAVKLVENVLRRASKL
jgi:D-amino-acid oxidase